MAHDTAAARGPRDIAHDRPSRLASAAGWAITYALAIIFLGFGAAKFSAMAGESIAPLVKNSPFVFWWHDLFGINGTARVVGVFEIVTGLLIAGRLISARLSMIGGAMGVITFLVTLSFLLSTPGTRDANGLTMLGEFLLKDLVLLAAALWIFAASRATLKMKGAL